MPRKDLGIYIRHLKDSLNNLSPNEIVINKSYIDLSQDLSLEDLPHRIKGEGYLKDPLVEVFEEILEKFRLGQIDRIKIGINELLKSLILNISAENEETLTKYYLYRIRLIFKRSLLKDFPYYDDLWEYLSNCINTLGIYLIDNNFHLATKELLEATAKMGKVAAQNGMATSSTQWCLRNLENKALSMNLNELANYAKNFRFNLESY